MRFREHRGGLEDSLATSIELADKAALINHARALLSRYPGAPPVTMDTLHVEPYVFDHRCGWDTYMVRLDGYGPLGFTDGPCEK